MLNRVKTLLGIDDFLQDEVLEIIIENVEGHLTYLLGKDVPFNLQFIVNEISIMRYNRLGAEGYKSELVEGHRTDFFEPKDDFQPYMAIIEKEAKAEVVAGKVRFL